jgi:tetratricopeptide (TPR) repeat protein
MRPVSIFAIWLIFAGVALGRAEISVSAIAQEPLVSQAAAAIREAAHGLDDLRRQALQEGESGRTEEALRDYGRALELDPTWKEGRWNLGMLQYSARRFPDAELTFEQVVQFAPQLGIAWGLLGLSEFETGAYANSLAHLEKAQSLGIQDDTEIRRVATYHLALLWIRAGEFERASDLLIGDFSNTAASPQVKTALGLAMLKIPLLPAQVDPSEDALISAAGDLAASDSERLVRFPALLKVYPDVPYLHYAYGLALVKSGHPQDAVPALREETKISPESPLPWIELSRLQLSQSGAALLAAHKAVALAPGNKSAHEALAKALEAAGKSDLAASESSVAKDLAVGPPPAEARIVQRYSNASPVPKADDSLAQNLSQQAMREYASARYPETAHLLKEWLRTNPEDGTSWAMLGLCEFSMKDYDNALIHLDRGSQLGVSGGPESVAMARSTLGILLVRAGLFERGSELLAAAYAPDSPNATVKCALGLALLRRAELVGPEQRQPALVGAAGEIAILLRQSKYDDAFPRLRQLLVDYPSVPFLHYTFGSALLALSEFDEAAAQMRAEIAISPSSELPLLRLASIALRQRDPHTAMDWAQRAIHLAPDTVDGHYLLGRSFLETGDIAAALHELEIASRLDPGSPEVHFNLAKAYERAKQPGKAQAERATFARLNAAMESQRSSEGTQIYSGPHDTGEISRPASAKESPSGSPNP